MNPRNVDEVKFIATVLAVFVTFVVGPALALAVGLAMGACSPATSLAPLDVRAQQNQQRAALAILAHSPDSGAVESLAESIYCGAGGTLRRAGQLTLDASVPCP